MHIEEYRKRVEEFTERLNREHYDHHSGRKETLETRGLYADFSDLFSSDAIREIQTLIDGNPAGQESRLKSLQKLRAFAVEHYLESNSSALAEEISEFDSRSTLSWNGRSVFLTQIPYLLANEPDHGRRRELQRLRAAILEKSNGMRREKVGALQRGARDLGFKSYLDACRTSTGVDYVGLVESLEPLLSSTESLYLDRLRESVEMSLGIRLAELHRRDVGRWTRGGEYDALFPKTGLLSAVSSTVRGLGIDPDKQASIRLDLEDRPRKQPRAFCSPIRIPQEIVISLSPRGGYDDYVALLHETGHAQHFAWTSADLAAEHRVCGDRGLSEIYAFLFEHLAWNKGWLSAHTGVRKADPLVRFLLLVRTHLVRRYCSKLRYEVMLLGEQGLDDPERAYVEILGRGTGMAYDRESHLEDLDEWFYTADYLRAWILEAQLRDYLQSRFGTSWFESSAAGSFLKEIWETGQLYDVDQLGREIGFGPPDVQVLADELRLGLQG